MAILSEWVRHDDGYLGHLFWPERAQLPLPAVLVIQEAWGVDVHIDDVAHRFAAAGYAAFAPDLFAGKGERPEALTRPRLLALQKWLNDKPNLSWLDVAGREAALAELPEPQRTQFAESFAELGRALFNLDGFMPQLLAASAWLRREGHASRGQKVASVGFCMGGGLSARLACQDPELAAAAIFYGPSPPPEQAAGVRCPLLGLYAGEDARINSAVPAFAEAVLRAGQRFERKVYPGVKHAFFNDGRVAYDVAAARDAFVRVLELFRDRLAA